MWALSPACTSEDPLLEGEGSSGAGVGGAGQGGASPTTGGTTNQGGTAPSQGGAVTGGKAPGDAGSGGAGETGGNPSEGGESAATGGQNAGNAGAGAAGASSGAGGVAGPEPCPTGQTWCPGCTTGSGRCATACDDLACPACSDIADFDTCEATSGCHSVLEDAAVCSCGTAGCCARFVACAPGEKADCEGRSVQCDAMTPFCEGPAHVVSYSGWCYEGCVDPKDCGACGPPDDPAGCLCYVDQDCPTGNRCYGADCGSETPGTCRMPPADGCFGDADCDPGQACIGGRPAACNTAMSDAIGTCTTEACPDGDCLGSFSADCTCSDGNQCVAATGPTGSGQCRNADGTCALCKCAAPDTAIATPTGERPIAELEAGDLVYSVDGAGIRAVKILRVNRTPVFNHRVLRVTLDNGRAIEMTAGHPLADGLPLSTLRPGSELLGASVVTVTDVPYAHDATFDILPDSTSGAYFAAGVLIGSTLSGARGELPSSSIR